MAAGGPNDHPLSDVLIYNIETYGKKADAFLVKLQPLMSQNELYEWWGKEIGCDSTPEKALQEIIKQYSITNKQAKENGWEI